MKKNKAIDGFAAFGCRRPAMACRTTRVACASIIAVCIALMPLGVAAQEGEAASYRNLIAEALREYRIGNWEEARSLFMQAHRLTPSARTLRGLGMASFEARRYPEALLALQGALRDARKPLTREQRADVEKLVERAKRLVASYELRLQPPSAVITVDGCEAVVDQGRLLLSPGRHEIVAKADGYETAIRQMSVDGGSSGTFELTLRPLPDADGKPAAPKQKNGWQKADTLEKETRESEPPSESPESEKSADLLPWIVLGSSGVVAVTGTVMLLLALDDKSSVENAGDGVLLEEIEDAHDRVPIFSTLGAVLLGAGIAGAAVGIVLLSTGGPSEEEPSVLALTPNGLSLRGSL